MFSVYIQKYKDVIYGLFAVLVILLVGFAVYSNTLNSTFHYDDKKFIVLNESIRNPLDLHAIWKSYTTRFVPFFTFALNYKFNGLQTFGYHLVNLFFHLSNALLVWWFVLLTFSTPFFKSRDPGGNNKFLIALFSAMIFVSHPVQTSAVSYIYQRVTVVECFFYILAVNLYIKSRLLQISGSSMLIRRLSYAGSLLSAMLAMASKENAAILPFTILFYEIFFLTQDNKVYFKKITPFFITILIIAYNILCADMKPAMERIGPQRYLLTEFRVLVTYVRLLILPINQSLDYDYPIQNSLLSISVIMGLALIMSLLFISFKMFSKKRLISFGILWFLINLIPESSLWPIKDVINEYRLYLPMIGFYIAVVTVVFYIFRNKRSGLAVIFLSLIVIYYSTLAYGRNFVWKDEAALWEDVVRKAPNKARGYNNLGLAYYWKDLTDRAIEVFGKGLAIQVSDVKGKLYYNRGLAYNRKKLFDKAIDDFNNSMLRRPEHGKTYYQRGLAYMGKDMYDEALADFGRALSLGLYDARIFNSAGVLYSKRRMYNKAIASFNLIITALPSDITAYNNRGIVFTEMGLYDEAVSDFDRAIKLDPRNAKAYYNRARAYMLKNMPSQALADFDKAIDINPNFVKAYLMKARAYETLGMKNDAINTYRSFIEKFAVRKLSILTYAEDRLNALEKGQLR